MSCTFGPRHIHNNVCLEHVQLRALLMFFGVGTLHPKQSVTAMGSGRSAVVWLARLHCTLFWLKVLSSKVYDGKLFRRVAL